LILITIVHRNKTVLLPLIFAFKDEIKKHILVYDKDRDDTRFANELKTGIKKTWQQHTLPNVDIEMVSIDEDSHQDISSVKERFSKEDGASLYLNAAESDAALLTVISGHILSIGGKVLAYDKRDNTYNSISQTGFGNSPINVNMKINDFLTLMGEEYIDETNKVAIRENNDALLEIFGDAKRMFKIREMLKNGEARNVRERYPDMIKSLEQLNLADCPQHLNANTSYSQFGNYFEQFVYTHMDRFDFDDIKTGIRIAFEREKYDISDNVVSNEFDILTIKNNQIGIVECKIGDNINPSAVIYKNDALMDNFGDNSSCIIVNIQPDKTPHLAQSSLNFGDNLTLRANSKQIDIFNAFDLGKNKFSKMIRETFGVLPRRFLLGGHDLEMVTILQILKKTHQSYEDRHLQWGAKLSDYIDLLNDDEHFYAIELEIDIEPPKNFTLIDHHNELQTNPSAIEQICLLLDYPMSRLHKLIALNDSGYIPALVKFGANKKEIEDIRKLDRKAQGVTEADENLAELSLQQMKVVGDIAVIEALTKKFSPITDRLYDKNILIYTDSKLTYYGSGVELLVSEFPDLLKDKKAYFGGGNGFFGIAENLVTQSELIGIRKKILQILQAN